MSKLSPRIQKVLGWMASIIVLVLLFGGGAVAAQVIFDPENAVDDTGQSEVDGSSGIDAVSAVSSSNGVLQVFTTSATFNGSGPAGYGRTGMHAACQAEDPDSHFCTIQEIENAWKTGGVNMMQVSQAWVDNAIVGTIDSGYGGNVSAASDWYGGNDSTDYPYNCNAWLISTNAGRGMIMNTGAISPAAEACDDIHPITCCK